MTYTLNPYDHLTVDVIDQLIIHHTVSDLRRALERSPWIQKVDETDKIPTIYYRKGSTDPNVNDWTLHALCMDLHRFNLKKSAEQDPVDPPIECKYRSSISWDNISGIQEGKPLLTYLDRDLLIFDGYIAHDCCRHGNYVNVILTLDKFDYSCMKDSIYIEYQGCKFDKIESNIIVLPIKFKIPGQEIPIKLYWSSDHMCRYHVCLTQESILL